MERKTEKATSKRHFARHRRRYNDPGDSLSSDSDAETVQNSVVKSKITAIRAPSTDLEDNDNKYSVR